MVEGKVRVKIKFLWIYGVFRFRVGVIEIFIQGLDLLWCVCFFIQNEIFIKVGFCFVY